MARYDVVQILDLADIIGEDALKEILSDFSCPLNYEIEDFLKRNAIDFARKKMSIYSSIADINFIGRIPRFHCGGQSKKSYLNCRLD